MRNMNESSADAFVLGVEPSSFVGVSFAGLRMPIRYQGKAIDIILKCNYIQHT